MSRDYRYIDPDNLEVEGIEEPTGSNAQCLADAMLDILQLGESEGMSKQDVDEAMRIVAETRSEMNRPQFKLILGGSKQEPAGD